MHAGYNHLTSTQLEAQKKHYESHLLEAKSRRETSKLKAVEKAVTSKIQDIRTKLEKLGEEKAALAEHNQTLIKNQDLMRKKVKEIEERKTVSLKSKDEKTHDLKEQIRDLEVFIKTQKKVAKMDDKDGVKGGTLLPVPLEPSTSAKKKKKTIRRRK
ncbi:BRAP2 RING ZnF UBP domain-containing protein 1-like [Syzygium oleosum]|uniref:BRAP2 RING ZnF UBP domain-containing protein 1-like n=1 Tax=Syzygium oleosum TaxID=219896 RepID=UPI0024BBBAC7|nr:BRAP2 RING ZnF UBP domain-containing protein 1-like [Syzygium oleosum]